METLLVSVIFIFLFILSYTLMYFTLKNKKYLQFNPFKVEVPTKTVYLIDRFGKTRIKEEGFQDYLPFIDEIEAIISLKEEIIYFDKLEIFTFDNKKINLHYHVVYKVIEPMKAFNNIYDYKGTLRSLVIISTLNIMSNTLKKNINTNSIQKIREEIEEKSLNWGIEIPRILFDNITS